MTESFADYWRNNAWVETSRGTSTYINDTIPNVSLSYSKNNSGNWWVSSRQTYKYCGVVNTIQDLNGLKFKIFPNPANLTATLDLEESISTKNNISVYNNIGKLIFQESNIITPYSLDISNYLNGLYIVKVYNSKQQFATKKILVAN